jgi:2-polyprenyl-3-methyl-5-hydroxy-6-metoxy-1,4-benzoquinol methylase
MGNPKDILSSEEFYGRNSLHYETLKLKRSSYIDAVNACIFRKFERGPILDVGCGDGLRALYFKDQFLSDVTGLDSCFEMCEKSKENGMEEVLHEDIASISLEVMSRYRGRFGTVLCLWNVLGHVVRLADRERAIRNMAELLHDGGLLFIDVNNRLNISQYGIARVLKNLAFGPFQRERGTFRLPVGDSISRVYLATKREFSELLNRNGFVVENMIYVNYQKGTLENSWTKGQILAVCRKRL